MGGKNARVAAAIVGLLPLFGGCEAEDCTLVSYDEGLLIDLEPEGHAPNGAYHAELTADGTAVSIDWTIAAGEWLTPEPLFVPMGNERFLRVSFTRRFELHLEVHAVGETLGGPKMVDLVVYRDDDRAFHKRFTPRYDVHEPNGDGCGEQRIAHDMMRLDLY